MTVPCASRGSARFSNLKVGKYDLCHKFIPYSVGKSGIITEHYIRNWNSRPKIYLWDKGPVERLSSEFRVLKFEPSKKRKMWTYATCGMSEWNESRPIELHIFSKVKDVGLVEILTAAAYYHRTKSNLGLHHTINFGRPWQNHSKCEFGLITLPYLDGPDLELLEREEKVLSFYWLIPITMEELNFKLEFGAERLEDKFQSTYFNFVDPKRKSVV